jgi:hypothetical protein
VLQSFVRFHHRRAALGGRGSRIAAGRPGTLANRPREFAREILRGILAVGNFRFYRRVHIFPGLSINLSKSGPSVTVGIRGAHLTLGHQGVTRTVGLPGTGIYYTSHSGYHSGIHSAHTESPADPSTRTIAEPVIGLVVIAIIVAVALAIGIAIAPQSEFTDERSCERPRLAGC